MKIKPYNSIAMLFFLLAAIFIAGCDDDDKTFQGDPIFAFGASSANLVINHLEPKYDVPVMLVGPHFNVPKTLTFEVLPYLVSASGDTIRTNVEPGVHYKEFTSNQLVVAPNTSTTHIPLEINFDNMERCGSYVIIFELTGGDFSVSAKANNIMIVRFSPHRLFIPENYIGTFPAREISNQPNLVREYNVTLELDSIYPGGKRFAYSVSGLYNIAFGDSTANAWDRRKIRIMVDDTNHCTSEIGANSPQDFFRISDGTFIVWERRANGTFNTWDNTFNFPAFNLKRKDNDNPFPAQPNTPRGQNVRVQILN